MPNPTVSDLHVNSLLTNVGISFIQDAKNFVADQVFPTIQVPKQSDIYPVWNQGDFWRDTMQVRADGAESAGDDYRVDTSNTYYAQVYSIHKDITEQQLANADTVFELEKKATEFLMQKALIRKDAIWAANYFTTSTWTTDQTGHASTASTNQFIQWNSSSSIPISDIETQKDNIWLRTGMAPTHFVMGTGVLAALKNHADTKGAIQYTRLGIPNLDSLSEILGVKCLVARAAYNSAAEAATTVQARIVARDDALLLYAPTAASTMAPSGGYTFSWSGLTGSQGSGIRVKSFEIPERGVIKRVELDMAVDLKLTSALAGVFFNGAVA